MEEAKNPEVGLEIEKEVFRVILSALRQSLGDGWRVCWEALEARLFVAGLRIFSTIY